MPIKIAESNFYSAEEVAEKLNLKLPSIRGYIRVGKINAKKIGRKNYISENDFLQFMSQSIKTDDLLIINDEIREYAERVIDELLNHETVIELIKSNKKLRKSFNSYQKLRKAYHDKETLASKTEAFVNEDKELKAKLRKINTYEVL